MGVALVSVGIEHVVVGRRDVHVPKHDLLVGSYGDHVAEGGEPLELVLVVVGVGRAAVGHVHAGDTDAATGGRDHASLGLWEARPTLDSASHVFETDTRQDR